MLGGSPDQCLYVRVRLVSLKVSGRRDSFVYSRGQAILYLVFRPTSAQPISALSSITCEILTVQYMVLRVPCTTVPPYERTDVYMCRSPANVYVHVKDRYTHERSGEVIPTCEQGILYCMVQSVTCVLQSQSPYAFRVSGACLRLL